MDFKKVEIQDKEIIEYYLSRHNTGICDLTFANIIAWQDTYDTAWCIEQGFITIRFAIDDENHLAYTRPIGHGDYTSLIPLIEQDALRMGQPMRFYGISEQDSKSIREAFPEFGFSFDRAHCDYVYLREDLAGLKGRKYQQKRNHVNHFNSLYPETEYRELTPEMSGDCLELLDRWRQERGDVGEMQTREMNEERLSIKTALSEFRTLDLVGGSIYVDNRMVAFCYGSELSPDTFCTHIEKADERYEGSFAAINRSFAEHLPKRYTYINREDDMGLPGLRKAKESYHPHHILRKYSAQRLSPVMLQLRSLWMECFPEDSLNDAEQFIMSRFRPENLICKEEGGQIVSMLHLISFGEFSYIYGVATARKWRGLGYASELVVKAVERCRREGRKAVLLIPGNDSLRGFYARLGFSGLIPISFRTLDEYDFGTGDTAKDLAMYLSLDGRPITGRLILTET